MHKILVFLLVGVGMVFSQHLELHTPEGSLIISLSDEAQYLQDKEQINAAVLVGNIEARLSHIEEIILPRLDRTERVDAELQLAEIRFLLNLFPKSQYIFIASYLPESEPLIYPISDHDLRILCNNIEQEAFADDKLNILSTAADLNYFLVEQVEIILDLFSFEDDRLSAVRVLYHKILDQENYFRLYSEFEFSDSKEELRKILQ